MEYTDYTPISGRGKTFKTSVDVEVMLYAFDKDELHIKLDERGRVQKIPKFGIKVSRGTYPYATLTLSERRAINLGLI